MDERSAARIDRPMRAGAEWECPAFVNDYRIGVGRALAAAYKEQVSAVERLFRSGFRSSGDRPTFVRGVRNELERADLVQEVFSRAFQTRARSSFDPSRPYQHYLLGIGRHVLVDWHRANRRRRRLDSALREEAWPVSLGGVGDEPGSRPRLKRYVDELGQPLKEVFELRIVGDRSQDEVATLLGLSRQNVRTLERRLRHGLKRLFPRANKNQPRRAGSPK